MEISHIHLLLEGEVSNREQCRLGKRRSSPGKRMLPGHIGCQGEPYVDNQKKKVARVRLEQSQEPKKKKKLRAMIKEIGKSEGGNERQRKFKN